MDSLLTFGAEQTEGAPLNNFMRIPSFANCAKDGTPALLWRNAVEVRAIAPTV